MNCVFVVIFDGIICDMNLKKLIVKVRQTVKDDGMLTLMRKTKNYLIYRIKVGRKETEMKDVLFVNGCTLSHPERYRVQHQMEQLLAQGMTADEVLYTEVDVKKIKFYRAVIVFRCPITENIEELIRLAHYHNKTVFYDIDDLVMDTKYTDEIENTKKMNREDRKVYDDGVIRMGKTMQLCDYCITTTPALARELMKYGKEVYVNKNVASEEMARLSVEAIKKTKKDTGKVRIGYLSGSITHNPDFELVKPAIKKIMNEFDNVELCLMGYIDLPKDLDEYKDRIVKMPFSDWRKLPGVIAGLDINLAPIEETVFNEAKSENKWTEAALCNVVTIASNFGAFKNVIEDGKTGVLCDDDEWYDKLRELIVDEKKRHYIASLAHKKAMEDYITTYSGKGLADFLESKMARNIAFVLPSTNISGGVNVVLKHCDILRRNGWDVMIINMDASDNDIVNNDGTINVISGVKHDIVARFDTMVATLFTTLDYVKRYPEVRYRAYLVQNFETDFNSFGNPARNDANATYNSFVDLKYLTISKWCKKWLEEKFNKNVKYAPNGIDLKRFEYKERSLGKKVRILVEGNSDDYYKNVDESFRIVEKLDPAKYEIWYLSYQGEPKKWYRVDKFCHKVSHDEVGKIYGGCDILLKTSILESFSYPPLEMMATGGFVVAAPNGGNLEYLKDGENCLLYVQGNIEDAVEKIELLVTDNRLRSKLAKNGRKTAEGRDWGKIEDGVVDLYR